MIFNKQFLYIYINIKYILNFFKKNENVLFNYIRFLY